MYHHRQTTPDESFLSNFCDLKYAFQVITDSAMLIISLVETIYYLFNNENRFICVSYMQAYLVLLYQITENNILFSRIYQISILLRSCCEPKPAVENFSHHRTTKESLLIVDKIFICSWSIRMSPLTQISKYFTSWRKLLKQLKIWIIPELLKVNRHGNYGVIQA